MPDVMKTVGRYELLREVGRGGMALVYLARQTDLDRFVALKELGAFHASDPSFAQRFLRESRVAGSLSHPNIVTVHDYFEHDGTPYIAMEYIERGSLRPYIGRMNMAQIGGVLEGLLAGLVHGESHGIVHRDLKPENLMVTADGRVKIADFGIAKATTKMQTGAFLTATGTTVGTPTYMAPEQAMAQDIGSWTDLYSVGCMAFEMFSGNVPFHDSDAPMAILLRHVNEPIAPVKSIRPEVDQRISDWIEKLLVKEPTQRTQTANDAWDEFEEILLNLLGPRWRREARLLEGSDEPTNGAKPLTPAPFPGTNAGDVASEEFKSFAWGAPGSDTGAAAAPPMWTPPPSENTPSIPEPVVGPPTPLPSEAVPAPAPPAPEPVADAGFVTFGSPAPPPPTDALMAPAAEAATAPAAATPPPVEATPAPAGFDSPSGFAAPPADLAPPAPAEPPEGVRDLHRAAAVAAADQRAAAGAAAGRGRRPGAGPDARAHARPVHPEPEPVGATMMPQTVRPEPVAAPAAPQEGSSSGRKVVFGLVAAGVLLVVVIGVVLMGGGGGEDPPAVANKNTGAPAKAAPAVPVSASGISLKVPAGWSDGGELPEVPGFAAGAVAMGGDKGGVVFGKADETAANSTLLADDVRAAAGTLPEKAIGDIGDGNQAAHYTGLPIGRRQDRTFFAVPTTEGVATLACSADAATCETIASSMKITEGTAFPVGPSAEYAGSVEGILGKLEKAEKSAAGDLKQAGKRATQVAATRKLAAAYTGAAGSLGKLDVSPADALLNAQMVDSLRAAGAAYKKAAAEGNSKDRAGYKREGGKARAAGGDLGKALDGLKIAGYEVPAALAKGAAAVTVLPTLIKDKPKAKPKTNSGGSTTPPASSGGSTTPPSSGQTFTPPSSGGSTHPARVEAEAEDRRRRRRRPLRRRRGLGTTNSGASGLR